MKRTLYGVGTPLMVQAVTVADVQGSTVTVSGGPSCGPDEYCGQLLPSMSVTFAVPPPVSLGDVINLYGTTIAAGLTPTAVQVIGYCNPDFGC